MPTFGRRPRSKRSKALRTQAPRPTPNGYTPLSAQVLAVISAHDPEGLLEFPFVPRDEYNPEAKDFETRIRPGQHLTAAVVTEVWERWFGPASGYVTYAKPGEIEGLAADLDALRLWHKASG
jgi:hypothetical protein